ncbi:hypothetical protein SAMN04488003_101294 [Loktanella fryxellensis]|uniref:Muramidase (Phage lambda lysozyme) n=1 Tax=Loktanella fryxellensis TaxID=245187 RepID=A0A1H7YS28_9RHOB|nr:hypothetical protein [Loktanella fryxellensis]SEM49052.1 hypothetical protein SAMN04488003_101294 [Loktanella fryxellensis]
MTPFRRFSLATFLLGLIIAVPEDAPADALSLAGRMPILPALTTPDESAVGVGIPAVMQTGVQTDGATVRSASLFAGATGRSFFAPLPPRDRTVGTDGNSGRSMPVLPGGGDTADRVRHLIAAAEAGPAGYDAVQYGARVKPGRPPTALTIAEIYAWIDATPGQPHAIGRYQFIPPTLRRLVDITGIDPRAQFTPQVQDALADVLLAEAGFADLTAGRIDRVAFMNNLAKIWAGLPTSNGRSYYHGYAGNHATMTWARYDAEMRTIFPG